MAALTTFGWHCVGLFFSFPAQTGIENAPFTLLTWLTPDIQYAVTLVFQMQRVSGSHSWYNISEQQSCDPGGDW